MIQNDKKVMLDQIREKDEERFWLLSQQDEVLRYLPDWQMTRTYSARLAEASRESKYLSPKEQNLLFGIYEGETLRGAFSMGPEWRISYRIAVGFWLEREAWGRGLVQEALKQGEKAAKEAGVDSLYALTEEANKRAQKALSRAGFRETERKLMRPEGKTENTVFVIFQKLL